MKLKIGGVPEHFNYLWKWTYTHEVFRKHGYYLQFYEYKGGTGAMIEALEKGEIDFALMLTEGAIASINKGSEFKIWMPFVISPLIWGIFTSATNEQLPSDFENSKFAVSRLYSGSHLMSQFLANQTGQKLKDENFVITKGLDGAIEALANKKAHYFLWEKYMTMHLVEKRIFDYKGDITAPWPAFVFVAKSKLDLIEFNLLKSCVLDAVNNFINWKKSEAENEIANYFGLRLQDVADWLNEVKYYDGNNYWKDRIVAAQIIMHQSKMIDKIAAIDTLVLN